MTTAIPELLTQGLTLWRLRRSRNEQLWCSVRDREGSLALIVQDPSMPRTAISEAHPHVESLVDRAESLRQELEATGWQPVDVDIDETG